MRFSNGEAAARLRRALLLGLTAVLAAFAVAGCGGSSKSGSGSGTKTEAVAKGPAIPAGPITLGFAIGKTGVVSFYDLPMQQGAKMAIADINARGGLLGHKLRMIDTDTQTDPTKAGPAAAKLISQGARLIVPMCDYDLGSPSSREAANEGVLSIVCAGSPLQNLVGPLSWDVVDTTPSQAAGAAAFSTGQGYRKAYLLIDTAVDFSKSWCKAFQTTFESEGGRIVGQDTYQNGDQSVAAQVTRLKDNKNADMIALCGFPPTGATVVKQLRSAGVTLPIVTTSAMSGPSWVAAVPGVSNVYAAAATSLFGDDPNPEINAFFKRFKTPQMSDFSVYGYSIVQAFAEAVKRANSVDGQTLSKVMPTFNRVDLLVGPTTFSNTCRVPLSRPVKIVQFQNGRGSYLRSATAQNVPYPKGIGC